MSQPRPSTPDSPILVQRGSAPAAAVVAEPKAVDFGARPLRGSLSDLRRITEESLSSASLEYSSEVSED